MGNGLAAACMLCRSLQLSPIGLGCPFTRSPSVPLPSLPLQYQRTQTLRERQYCRPYNAGWSEAAQDAATCLAGACSRVAQAVIKAQVEQVPEL